MHNPFEDLGKPAPSKVRGEEVSGTFSCQEPSCNLRATTARYLREVEVLTWKCKDGHISSIKGTF